jgi:hypothetical protein
MHGSFREWQTIQPNVPTLWSAGVLLAIQVATSSLKSLINAGGQGGIVLSRRFRWGGLLPVIKNQPAIPNVRSQTTELANFHDDQRYIVGEWPVAPRSHAVKDRLPHFRQRKLCRIDD